MKNQNSISRLQSRSEQSGANKQNDFARHCANRRLKTETVLNYLRKRLPRQYELAEVVGKWVWLDVSPIAQTESSRIALGAGLSLESAARCLAASVREL